MTSIIFFFLYKRIPTVGQFCRKQKQANITKSVFIHGDIVTIYKYVQYKNVWKADFPAGHAALYTRKQPGFPS